MFIEEGDILGHEPMGIVEEVGPEVTNLAPGDRVVMPFQISCGHCFMCGQGLQTQCETMQVRDQNMGAALFGYTKLYGEVEGGQAEFLRVPQAQYTHVKVPHGPPDERFLYLSDVLPISWQAVEYAGIPDNGSVTVLGLGPIGDMSGRIALHRGHRVIAVDLVPSAWRGRGGREQRCSTSRHDDLAETIREMTDGRGTDSAIDAVGWSTWVPAQGCQQLTVLPDNLAQGACRRLA
jgi:threonine dehydrogenase-like Zn-dependent dehydrogenase